MTPERAGGSMADSTDAAKCPSVIKDTTKGSVRTVTRYVRCQREGEHSKHFAAWGGSQAWRQMEWPFDHPQSLDVSEVPKGRRVW